MFQNYLKIAVRGLFRNKLYLVINIFGLGIALAGCIIGYLNWKFNHDFDAFHSKRDNLFRVEVFKDGHLYGTSPLPLADAAAKDIAGVESSFRGHWRGQVVKFGEQVHNERILYASDNFLESMDFPLIMGDRESLKDKRNILISESTAKKYFGEAHPMGQTLSVNPDKPDERNFIVGAVFKDTPLNSTFRFDFLTQFKNQLDNKGGAMDTEDWSQYVGVTFLELNNPADAPQIVESLNQYVPLQNSGVPKWKIERFHLEPFKNVAYQGRELRSNWLWPSFPDPAVWGPIVMGLMLLITACLNFTNTTISLSSRRLKEMGVRKVMGSSRSRLMIQLMSENLVICSLALLASVAFVDFLLPYYNEMWEYLHLETNYFQNPPLLLFMAAAVIIAAFMGGAYPAIYISAFNPANIFRGSVKFGGSNLFSRMLLGVQVMISLASVIVGIAFANNSEFQRTTDIGYEYNDVLVIPTWEDGAFETFRSTIEQHPKVIASSGTRHQIDWMDARTDVQIEQQPFESFYLGVGENYLDVMDLELVEGRSFDKNRKLDYENAVLINQKFAAAHQWEDPIGQKIVMDSTDYFVIGVVKDFLNEGFFAPLVPIIFELVPPKDYNFWVVEAKPQDLLALNETMKAEWNGIFPFNPYEGFFQSELMQGELTVSDNIATIMLFMAIVAIFLSSAGLFALVSLNIMKRLKEIAIRKVVGAPTSAIAWLVNKNYVWIFLVAAIGGSIGGTFMAKQLLNGIFATYNEVGMNVLLFSSVMVFIIASLTIGYKVWEVSRTNPSDILRAD